MQPAPAPADIRVLLFDVGGVLVELGGVEAILGWLGNRMTPAQLWQRWLHSVAVRQFETGRIDQHQFAAGVIREFGLDVQPLAFLESFVGWPTGLYPGTLELLGRIPRRYRRALLSNSNALHWPRVLTEMQLGPAIDHHFVSHLMGRINPMPKHSSTSCRRSPARPAKWCSSTTMQSTSRPRADWDCMPGRFGASPRRIRRSLSLESSTLPAREP